MGSNMRYRWAIMHNDNIISKHTSLQGLLMRMYEMQFCNKRGFPDIKTSQDIENIFMGMPTRTIDFSDMSIEHVPSGRRISFNTALIDVKNNFKNMGIATQC